MTALLEVTELTTRFPMAGKEVPIVDALDFEVGRGEVLALVGESGSGKSMTALSLMRLVPKPGRVASGSVRLDGEELLNLPVRAMRRVRGAGVAMIFQEPMTSLNPVMRVGEQVVEAIRLHERVGRSAALDRCRRLFEQVGIPDAAERVHAYPHQLSGGLKQRVMIAMALSARPRLLIADEPTTALDVTVQAQILRLLRDIQEETDMSILLITHDLGIVNEIADRVAVLYAGRIVETAPRTALFENPMHPYTQGLLRSMPALALSGRRLPEIPGVVPSPSDWPTGCRFASRCSKVMAVCEGVLPEFRVQGPGHDVACYALQEAASRGEKKGVQQQEGAS
ncbi:MAG: ABC transporter ATP-binding protein [Myxococcota bacterium]|nr:ABC transporter ATP-binding protein [Myxococcota bacterium]